MISLPLRSPPPPPRARCPPKGARQGRAGGGPAKGNLPPQLQGLVEVLAEGDAAKRISLDELEGMLVAQVYI